MSGASARARWVARQITRAPVRSVLTALMAFLFSLALLWLRATIIHSQGEIEELYKSLKVDSLFSKTSTAIPAARILFQGSSACRRLMS